LFVGEFWLLLPACLLAAVEKDRFLPHVIMEDYRSEWTEFWYENIDNFLLLLENE